MKLRNYLAAVAAVAMTSAPIVAHAAGTPVRAGSSVEEAESIGGGFLLPLLAVLAVIVAVVVIADDDESPASP